MSIHEPVMSISSSPGEHRMAVVDLGTITTRLVLAEPGDGRRLRFAPITRMGADLVTTGRLSSEALGRVRDALEAHRDRIVAFAPAAVRVVATAAARQASNRHDLFELVQEVLGVETELLSGRDEGRLTFVGAIGSLPASALPDGPGVGYAVLDIGGGSTEFATGGLDGGLTGVFSTDIGASKVTAGFLHHDPPWAEELSAGLSVVQLHLDDLRREVPGLIDTIAEGTVVGVGGTITTLAAIEMGLDPYDSDRVHGAVLHRDDVEEVFRMLATESRVDRLANPGLNPERVDLIVGGCVIVVEAMRHLGIERIVVSEADLMDGCLTERGPMAAGRSDS